MYDENTCPSCEGKMKQIAGSEYENPVKRDQLWECEDCEYREER